MNAVVMKVCPHKTCIHGGKPQAVASFHKCASKADGRVANCRDCCAAASRAYRALPEGRAAERAGERAYRARLPKHHPVIIARSLRHQLLRAVKPTGAKPASALELLGCTIPEFRRYIEAKFLPGMTWDNWTTDGWHIDHIRPLASFDLTDPAHVAAACHYTNLQPLWAVDNLRKGDTWAGLSAS